MLVASGIPGGDHLAYQVETIWHTRWRPSGIPGGDVVELFNSGATRHKTPHKHLLENYRQISPKSINAANKHTFNAIGQGDMHITIPNGESGTTFILKDVLYSPDIAVTLISVGRIDMAGYTTMFGGGACVIRSNQNKVVGWIPIQSGLYCTDRGKSIAGNALVAEEVLTIMELHHHMGHIAPDAAHLVTNGVVKGIKLDSTTAITACDSCMYAKMTRTPVPKERKGAHSTVVGAEVHTDVWGLSPIKTMGAQAYYVSFTDDKSRFTQVHLLSHKSDVFDAYCKFEAWLKTQYGISIKALRSDRGGEYMSNKFTQHLTSHGMVKRLTVHDTPQQNGVAECLNRILLECTRALLHASGLPKSLWGEALAHAIWLKNHTSMKALNGHTPLEELRALPCQTSRMGH